MGTLTFAHRIRTQMGSVGICERRRRVCSQYIRRLPAHTPSLPGWQSLRGWWRLVLATSSQQRGLSPTSVRCYVPTMAQCPVGGLPWRLAVLRAQSILVRGLSAGQQPPSAVAAHRGDRSPGASWPPAPLESVDRWPLAIIVHQISWGEPPRGIRRSPVLSTGSGPSTRGPYAAACQRPRGRPGRITCVRTGSEGLSGGIRMVPASLGTPREPLTAGRLVRPFLLTNF